MPANIRVIHAHDFIKVTPEGPLNLDESKKLLIELAAVSTHLLDYDIILDTRKVQSKMSVTDLWYLAAALSSEFLTAFSRVVRTAVLCPVERFDHAAFFALCADNRGFEVGAFTSVEDAYDWLVANRS